MSRIQGVQNPLILDMDSPENHCFNTFPSVFYTFLILFKYFLILLLNVFKGQTRKLRTSQHFYTFFILLRENLKQNNDFYEKTLSETMTFCKKCCTVAVFWHAPADSTLKINIFLQKCCTVAVFWYRPADSTMKINDFLQNCCTVAFF